MLKKHTALVIVSITKRHLMTQLRIAYILCILLTSCSETRHEPLTQPIHIEVTPEPPNPFEDVLTNIDTALTQTEQSLATILLLDGGLELLSIIIKNTSPDQKALEIIRMPTSDAKTMFLKASVNHLDTIDTLVILWKNFLPHKNRTNEEKLNILTKQTPKPEDDDLTPQDLKGTEENANDTEDIKHGTEIPPQH